MVFFPYGQDIFGKNTLWKDNYSPNTIKTQF